MLTIKALLLVNTEYLTAFGAFPPFFFVSDEMPYAEFSNVLEILDHAHAILGSIPVIQVVQPVAREAVTTGAILDFRVYNLLTVLDSAQNANFRLEAIIAKASGTWLIISCVCNAEAAIHSTGSD